MPKLTTKAILRSQADRLWFERYLYPNCEVCYHNKATQLHHFYYKSSYGHLRYDSNNGISLCRGCHFVLHNQDPKKIEEKIIAKRGSEWHEELKEKAQNPPNTTTTIGYYKSVIEQLKSS